MSSPSEPRRRGDRFRIDLATPADGAELSAIYNSDDGFGGDIAVKFTREPDPHASLLAEGERVTIPVVREVETDRAVGMGACVTRTAWVDGRPTRVGYLTGLKALPEFRRGVPMIPQVYAFVREQTADVGCYYTTILSENTLARRMLEKRRPNMPEYRPVGEYTTHCYRVARPGRGRAHLDGGTLGELVDLTHPRDLAPVGPLPGATDADVRMLRDRDGTPLAWCVLSDQRETKQYVITAYGGRYERLAKLPVHWLGYPRLPKPGAVADYVSLGMIGARDDDPALIARLLRAVGRRQQHRDFVMVGTFGDSPVAEALTTLRTITYSSQLYTVHFDDACQGLEGGQIALDVALL